MKVVTYWENAQGRKMPPYVALGIATMKMAFGDKSLLLGKENTKDFIGDEYLGKKWVFNKQNKNLSSEVGQIVAKSDFIRMQYVAKNGGVWLDADSIVFENFLPLITPFNETLAWHSEAFFGANPGNPILVESSNQALADELQVWGNPGGIKTRVTENESKIKKIPFKYINPGVVPTYSFGNCSTLLDKSIEPSDFLVNPDIKMMKLYNTDFSVSEYAAMSVGDFLDSEILLSKIFKLIDKKSGNLKSLAEEVYSFYEA